MAMYNETSTAPITKDSLLSASTSAIERLANIRERLAKIADTLHGPSPRPATDRPGQPEANSLRRNVDNTHQMINLIDNEIERIENRL